MRVSEVASEAAPPRVAFQGEVGAYGETAVSVRWQGRAHAVPARTFAAVLALVCAGSADYGVLPVWNSTIGEIGDACAALDGHANRIITTDDLIIPVRHALLGLPGASLDAVRTVGSHPAALAQCAGFFAERPHVTRYVAFDTAGAARELAVLADARASRDDRPRAAERASAWYDGAPHQRPHELAVLASTTAAARYGLRVLARDVQDDPANATRFVVVQSCDSDRA